VKRSTITTWHLCISGFTQTEGTFHGIVPLWRELHACLSSAEDVVSLRTWSSNWRDLAEHIFLVQQEQGERIRVAVYAYSWGGGYGLVRFAKELNKRGIPIEIAVLSDPVYCSPWYTFRWLAMTGFRKIVIPNNVRMVRWFYQRQNHPQSQGIVAQDPKRTLIVDGVEVDRTHQYMDDSGQFHQACHAAAEAL